jgi:hypothetical protein
MSCYSILCYCIIWVHEYVPLERYEHWRQEGERTLKCNVILYYITLYYIILYYVILCYRRSPGDLMISWHDTMTSYIIYIYIYIYIITMYYMTI